MNKRKFESIAKKWAIDMKSGPVLDVGCGNGRISVLVKEFLPQTELISMDLSKNCTRYVMRSISDEAIVIDATRLPLKDESASLIVCDQVIEHLYKQNDFVRELGRVLKPEGTLLIGSVLRKSHALSPYRNAEGKMVLDPGHIKEFESLEEYSSLFRKQFRVLETSFEPVAFPVLITLYKLLFTLGFFKSDLDSRIQRGNPALTNKIIYNSSPATLIKIPRPQFFYMYVLAKKK